MSVSNILLGDVDVEFGAVVDVFSAVEEVLADSKAAARVSLSADGRVAEASAR